MGALPDIIQAIFPVVTQIRQYPLLFQLEFQGVTELAVVFYYQYSHEKNILRSFILFRSITQESLSYL